MVWIDGAVALEANRDCLCGSHQTLRIPRKKRQLHWVDKLVSGMYYVMGGDAAMQSSAWGMMWFSPDTGLPPQWESDQSYGAVHKI